MRKILTISSFILLYILFTPSSFAYLNFEDTTKVGFVKYLSEYDDKDYELFYSKVGRKMFDWNSYTAFEDQKIKFVAETLVHYYNNGKSPIKLSYKATKKEVDGYTLKTSGGVKTEGSGKGKVFSGKLESTLNYEFKKEHLIESTEALNVEVSVEPGTQLIAFIAGEGLITNGVAKEYFFWHEINRGGYEIFVITSYYHKVEVLPI